MHAIQCGARGAIAEIIGPVLRIPDCDGVKIGVQTHLLEKSITLDQSLQRVVLETLIQAILL